MATVSTFCPVSPTPGTPLASGGGMISCRVMCLYHDTNGFYGGGSWYLAAHQEVSLLQQLAEAFQLEPIPHARPHIPHGGWQARPAGLALHDRAGRLARVHRRYRYINSLHPSLMLHLNSLHPSLMLHLSCSFFFCLCLFMVMDGCFGIQVD